MTTVKFYKNNDICYKLEVSGHTNFGAYGSDILCAALSSIVQTGALGIINVLKVNAIIKRDDDKGYFLIELPNNLTKKQISETQIIFNTIYEGVKDLQSGYSKNIKLEVK